MGDEIVMVGGRVGDRGWRHKMVMVMRGWGHEIVMVMEEGGDMRW